MTPRVYGVAAYSRRASYWKKIVDQLQAIAFDVDSDSLVTLREAFPGWEIEATSGTTTASLILDWNPAAADLLEVAYVAQARAGNQPGRHALSLSMSLPEPTNCGYATMASACRRISRSGCSSYSSGRPGPERPASALAWRS